MKTLLLDTHAWAWSLTGDARLSVKARDSLQRAQSVLVSPISFFEIGQKVRLGKWPEMAPFVSRLPALLEEQGGSSASLDPTMCLQAAMLAWDRRDPFDRLLAATALHLDVPIVSADVVFDGLVQRVW
ncbi:type II toxin-antitoxin system VapC family toxin [Oleomonas cavernae]|uniref:Type II toxin-antitoxin system VapC family toxin n=1 Tax=Oleomonas cavernae TaxID=2320859 RepID=A0A418WC78_9PROT|nr:type II toxin-antitoxin system VapC family toxin [Oleomonas cavernae]RJF87518.1 type II toxin-antitoxin system VapC family toxin [Oleomonas cavernae]